MKNNILRALILLMLVGASTVYAKGDSGSIKTTNDLGTAVNWNIYPASADVYISGGPQNENSSGLPDGTYYFQVTDPSGKTLLSTDDAQCRQVMVVNGRVAGAIGPCPHTDGTFNPANNTTPVQLAPFSATPNEGGVHKVWLVSTDKATIDSGDATVIDFAMRHAKTDNFKVLDGTEPPVPVGSCQPSSSLSVMTSGTDVVSYVPKGSWSGGATGIAAVNVEGAGILPTTNPIPTTTVVNSCASNSTTGETACSANNNEVYVIAGLAAIPTVTTLTTSGTGTISFSGGSCTNCGVAMDAVNNRAAIGLSVAGAPGFQILDLGTQTFEPAFVSPAGDISEDPLIDPIRDLLLSASYAAGGTYEIIDISTSTTPVFYENVIASRAYPDSSGEDCSTGIALAPFEFSGPSQVYIANLSSTSAIFTPGAPGTWSAPAQLQSLSESFLSAGASGLAVAQGTHTGIVSGEFGGDAITAIALPTAIDTSAAVPAISDWVTCRIPEGWSHGLDPHTVTAYQSPSIGPGNAIALLANNGATRLAVVDMTQMLNPAIVPRTVGGHGCESGFLPAGVVSFRAVP